MTLDRVRYYSKDNMLYGVDRIEKISVPEYDDIDINDAIEYDQIHRCFQNLEKANNIWTEEQLKEYSEKSKKLIALANRFFNNLNDENILDNYEKIESDFYCKSFWIIFDNLTLYLKISPNVFDKLLHNRQTMMEYILAHKNISQKYGEIIRKFFLEALNSVHIELLLRIYEQGYTKTDPLYLPKELNTQDINDYIESYIDSDNPELHCLAGIAQMSRSIKPLCISDATRLKARRKHGEMQDIIFSQNTISENECETSIVFSETQIEEKIKKEDEKNRIFSYGKKWLEETLDYPSLLNNFIYIFDFVDFLEMRSSHTFKEVESKFVLDNISRSQSSRIYPWNLSFISKNELAEIQMEAYYNFLLEHNIRYEDVLEWAFTKYLQKEFGCSEMRLSMPSENSTILEKCFSICSTFESAVKQFTLFVKYKEIDFDLLEIMSAPTLLKDVPSLLDRKYVYGKGADFDSIKNMLFSNQSTLCLACHAFDEKRVNNNFIELIKFNNIFLKDFDDCWQKILHQLADLDLLSINNIGLLKPGNPWKIIIVRDLFQNDVISYWHYPKESYPFFEELAEKEYLEFENTLLSRPEVHYFNYILNDKEFDNGPKLRNRYIHGNQNGVKDERLHQESYNMFLRIMTILIIKINDDFCLNEKIKKETR